MKPLAINIFLLLVFSWFTTHEAGNAQVPDPIVPPESLKEIPIPLPPDIDDYVKDRAAAVRLGKALFWDMQVGSDNIQACASCHFSAGADNRVKNQLNPGTRGGDVTFALGHGPNSTLSGADFPRPKANNDVSSSQGVIGTNYTGLTADYKAETGTLFGIGNLPGEENIFFVGVSQTRRVEPRNTPTVINAVFNFRNFWDGRANFEWNGVNPFGPRPPLNQREIYVNDGGALNPINILMRFASLASQASGPPGSLDEMSFAGRPFRDIGRKLLNLKPLGKQLVHRFDSVLGELSEMWNVPSPPDNVGLATTYAAMIQAAFHDKFWNSATMVNFGGEMYTQMEANFGFFFGTSVMMYEATLVSDDSKFDRVRDPVNQGRGRGVRFTRAEERGFEVFMNQGKCINCHGGAEFTNASVRNVINQQAIERMIMGDNNVAVYDNGFYNIGTRLTLDDVGVGGKDPFGNELSFSRQIVDGPQFDFIPFDPNQFEIPGPIVPGERVAVDGAHKVPTIRNTELTGPYMHNGGLATLMQVVQFYNRGGDFRQENEDNLDPDIQPLGLTTQQMNDLVAFMLTLTDDRVRLQKAPFDHPQLFIPNGHPGDQFSVTDEGGKATDELLEIPMVGAAGGQPLRTFLNLSPFSSLTKEAIAEGSHGVPQEYTLGQNYPNPFNPATTIRYSIGEPRHVRLAVYNTLGQEVAVLVDRVQLAGEHSAIFDASRLASGVYLYKLESGSFSATNKMVLLK